MGQKKKKSTFLLLESAFEGGRTGQVPSNHWRGQRKASFGTSESLGVDRGLGTALMRL